MRIPSLDAYLINSLQLRQDIVRLPVTEMGVLLEFQVLFTLKFLASQSEKRAAVIAVESPTTTFNWMTFQWPILLVLPRQFAERFVLLSSHQDDEGQQPHRGNVSFYDNGYSHDGF
jgi:hypothetical protein